MFPHLENWGLNKLLELVPSILKSHQRSSIEVVLILILVSSPTKSLVSLKKSPSKHLPKSIVRLLKNNFQFGSPIITEFEKVQNFYLKPLTPPHVKLTCNGNL